MKRVAFYGEQKSITAFKEWFGNFIEEKKQAIEPIWIVPPLSVDVLQHILSEPLDSFFIIDPSLLHKSILMGASLQDSAIEAVAVYEIGRHAKFYIASHPAGAEGWQEAIKTYDDGLLQAIAVPPLPSAKLNRVVVDYLWPLLSPFAHNKPLELRWRGAVFYLGDEPGRAAPDIIALAGRARILLYGPYLPIPLGEWLVKIFLGFSAEVEKSSFIVEVDQVTSIARYFFEVYAPGFYSLDFTVKVTAALQPVELRIISQEPAIQGEFSLLEVNLTKT